MKCWKTVVLVAFFLSCLLMSGIGHASTAKVSFDIQETWLDDNLYVQQPYFACTYDAALPAIQAINNALSSTVPFDAYRSLLSTLSPGSTGLRIDTCCIATEHFWENASGYLNVFIEVEGKMLQGPPSHRLYSMVFDADNGVPLSFDQLFEDPEGAKAYIEQYLEDTVSPTLSVYLENNQLFPVPYDSFGFSQRGHLIFYYPHDRLSFLGGKSGAIAFRYSELSDFLDLSPNSIALQFLEDSSQYASSMDEGAFTVLFSQQGDMLPGLDLFTDISAPALAAEITAIPEIAADSDYYPNGALFETEHPLLRGTYFITDTDETHLTGILSSRVDMYGIETGKTSLSEAKTRLGISSSGIPLDGEIADMYHVCSGTAVSKTYPLSSCLSNKVSALSVTLTLYADDSGIVQFCKLSLN